MLLSSAWVPFYAALPQGRTWLGVKPVSLASGLSSGLLTPTFSSSAFRQLQLVQYDERSPRVIFAIGRPASAPVAPRLSTSPVSREQASSQGSRSRTF